MSEYLEVNEEEYELTDNPSLRTVREVNQMETSIVLDYLDEDDLRGVEDLEDDGELAEAVIDNHGFSAFEDMMWDLSMLRNRQTLSLACDHAFDVDDFDSMGAKDLKNAIDACEGVLDGDAADFFEELNVGMLLTQESMEEM